MLTPDERDEHHDTLMDLAMDLYHHDCWRTGRQENPPEFDPDRWLAEAERVFLDAEARASESYVPARSIAA